MASMLVAHISDCHVVPAPRLCYGMVDTREWLARSIARIKAMSPRPDLVVISGDLIDEPSDEAYATLRRLLDPLDIPLVIIPGNHDDLSALAWHFPDHSYLPKTGKAHFIIDDHAVRLVAFDAVVPGKEWALITDADLEWLDAALSIAPQRPTMLVMHHPPIETGLAFMDAMQPPLHEGFGAILANHKQVRLILCGHVHRVVDGMLAHVHVAAAGSTSHQFRFAIDPAIPPAISMEPPAIRLHRWNDMNVTSFTVPVAEASCHLFPGVDEESWPAMLKHMREGASRAAVYPKELKARQ